MSITDSIDKLAEEMSRESGKEITLAARNINDLGIITTAEIVSTDRSEEQISGNMVLCGSPDIEDYICSYRGQYVISGNSKRVILSVANVQGEKGLTAKRFDANPVTFLGSMPIDPHEVTENNRRYESKADEVVRLTRMYLP